MLRIIKVTGACEPLYFELCKTICELCMLPFQTMHNLQTIHILGGVSSPSTQWEESPTHAHIGRSLQPIHTMVGVFNPCTHWEESPAHPHNGRSLQPMHTLVGVSSPSTQWEESGSIHIQLSHPNDITV